ncbi:MAG: T9SS type A sorting domain-containing protein [Flavobacteriales bacterium]|nr:T9SS type A sorting domain-containing protein [Flavobacteriales bacterium]
MKHFFQLTTLAILILLFSGGSFAQSITFEIDTIAVHTNAYSDGVDLTGMTTYRIYVVCETPEAVVNRPTANWTIDFSQSLIASTTNFWQSTIGGNAASDINCSLISTNPSLAYDSWVTIGCESSCDCAIPVAVTGGMYESWYTLFETGGDISIQSNWEGGNGNWNVPTTAAQAIAGDDLRILIGQFTTNGELCVNMMMQLFPDGYVDASSQSYYPTSATCNDGDYLLGCTNPTACNYNPDADGNDGSCILSGCTDPIACNYSASAGCDNGSCVYAQNTSGQVFHDINGNGVWNYYGVNAEPAIGSTGSISISELGITVFPDQNGLFDFGAIASGSYTLSYEDPNGVWDTPTDTWTTILPACAVLKVGLASINDSLLQIVNALNTSNQSTHCTNGINLGVQITNSGTEDLNGILTLQLPDFMTITTLDGSVVYDSFESSIVTWLIDGQGPGDVMFYQIHVNGPGAALMGETLNYSMTLSLVDINGNEVYNGVWDMVSNVICSYDPNDKQATPVGFEEPHFILPDDDIEYTIRFQNTGNAPAQNILITDTIEITNLNIDSFVPLYASHSFNTIVDESGHVQFVFDNINLPDSASDEINSHGFVVYKIRPIPTLPGWTEIHNIAHIYFDNNPAVVTNTTLHTIYDCNWLSIAPWLYDVCADESVMVNLDAPYVNNYEWTLDGTVLSETSSSLSLEISEPGDYEIGVTHSNELCSDSEVFHVNVHPNPEVTITYDEGTGIVSAPAGYSYSWFLFGEQMMTEIQSTFNPWQYATDEISVTLEVTSIWGCNGVSNTITATGIHEHQTLPVSIYPNPVTASSTLQLPTGVYQVKLFNAVGQNIKAWSGIQNTLQITNENLSSGVYLIRVMNELGQIGETMLVVK